MIYKAVKGYYKFFDETLSSTTFIVLIITLLVCFVGSIIPSASANSEFLKGNTLEIHSSVNTVVIDGVRYEITFSKIQ